MKKNAAITFYNFISAFDCLGLRVNETRPKQAGTAFNMP